MFKIREDLSLRRIKDLGCMTGQRKTTHMSVVE